MLKKILLVQLLVIVLLILVYYFYVRKRFMNNLHADLKLENFSNDLDGYEEMVDWYYNAYHIPSVTVAIIEDGKVAKYISRGTVSKRNDNKVDETSFYQIASTSKTFTGIICKALEMEGSLDLDRSISSFLQGQLSKKTANVFEKVSLRQVINHTSGLGRSMYAYAKQDVIDALENNDLIFEPGARFEYSNYGYALVTMILEQETKLSYGELIDKYISVPYNIDGFETDRRAIDPDKLARPYWKHFRLLDGEIHDFGIQIGASGLFTNVKSLASLLVEQMEDYQHFDSLKNSSSLILTHQKANLSDNDYYGYGFFEFNYDMDETGDILHTNLEHGGDADGYACIYDYFPKYKCGIVVLTSSGGKWLNQMTWNMNAQLVLRNYKKDFDN